MTITSRSISSRRAVAAAVLLYLCLAGADALQAQSEDARWIIDSKASLAWWQINPHYAHLWATTCPDDPSWQPGEGWSPGYYVDYLRRPKIKSTGYLDDRIPLYPRRTPRSLCREAVSGEVIVSDTVSWTGVEGYVVVLADSLVTGLNQRDRYARKKVIETHKYPELRFTIESLHSVQPGDTLRATAVGTFTLRGVNQAVEVPVTVVFDPGGIRIRGQWQFDAQDLVHVYGMSRWALGMGIGLGRWQEVHVGVDLVVRPGDGENTQ